MARTRLCGENERRRPSTRVNFESFLLHRSNVRANEHLANTISVRIWRSRDVDQLFIDRTTMGNFRMV